MRFAYADPPYVGQAKKHYGDHPDYAGEVDHVELIDTLRDEYEDGWSTGHTGAVALVEAGGAHTPRRRGLKAVEQQPAGLPECDQGGAQPTSGTRGVA